jgi:hypothetical protein
MNLEIKYGKSNIAGVCFVLLGINSILLTKHFKLQLIGFCYNAKMNFRKVLISNLESFHSMVTDYFAY